MYFRNLLPETGSGFQTLSGSPILKYWSSTPLPYPEHETFNLLFLNKKATSRQDSWAHNVLNKSYSIQLLYDTRLNVTIQWKYILETQ